MSVIRYHKRDEKKSNVKLYALLLKNDRTGDIVAYFDGYVGHNYDNLSPDVVYLFHHIPKSNWYFYHKHHKFDGDDWTSFLTRIHSKNCPIEVDFSKNINGVGTYGRLSPNFKFKVKKDLNT